MKKKRLALSALKWVNEFLMTFIMKSKKKYCDEMSEGLEATTVCGSMSQIAIDIIFPHCNFFSLLTFSCCMSHGHTSHGCELLTFSKLKKYLLLVLEGKQVRLLYYLLPEWISSLSLSLRSHVIQINMYKSWSWWKIFYVKCKRIYFLFLSSTICRQHVSLLVGWKQFKGILLSKKKFCRQQQQQ